MKSAALAWPASAVGTSGRSMTCTGVSLRIATTMPTPVGGEAMKRNATAAVELGKVIDCPARRKLAFSSTPAELASVTIFG